MPQDKTSKYNFLTRTPGTSRIRRRWPALASSILGAVVVSVAMALSTIGVPAAQASAKYVSPQFFGHHLMNQWGLTPAFPVHAMRLWDSGTKWCEIDGGTASGEYDFGQLDALLGQASRLGADVEFTFGGTPQWAADGSYPQSSTTNQCSFPATAAPPASESYWTNYVTAVVNNSKGKIHAYELWNEADDPNSWSGSMAQLVQMSVDAASIIHRIDPSALVLSPSTTADSTGYSFLRQYLAALPAGTIDGIAVHSYTNGAWPENTVPSEMQSVRAAVPAAFASLPIWSTEGGWGQNSQFSPSATLQSAFLARYDLMLLTNGVARSYWYAYQNSQWGTLWDGSALTPAGVATATLQNWLTGATLTGCSSADGNLWTCNLTTSAGAPAQIVWATTWAVWCPTTGFSTVKTLAGASSASNGWIQASTEPVLLS